MEQIFYLGGATGAGILSVAPVDNLTIWAWLLITAGGAIRVLTKQSRSVAKSVPVLSNARRPKRRAAVSSPWR